MFPKFKSLNKKAAPEATPMDAAADADPEAAKERMRALLRRHIRG